jgi:small subunit ribosomal protein S20
MPQSKSAKKALRQAEKRRHLNKRYTSKMKALIKEARDLIKDNKKEKAAKLLPKVYKAIDKTAKKGIIKKGNASRKKSRLTKAVNKLNASKSKPAKKTVKKKKKESK